MKYLSSVPFQVGGAGRAYGDGWDAIFGKCPTCGRRKDEQSQPLPERRLPDVTGSSVNMWRPCSDAFHCDVATGVSP
jgi:hypothetical protein